MFSLAGPLMLSTTWQQAKKAVCQSIQRTCCLCAAMQHSNQCQHSSWLHQGSQQGLTSGANTCVPEAHLGLPGPQQHSVTHPGAVYAQGRAPGTSAYHTYLGSLIRQARSGHVQAVGVSKNFGACVDLIEKQYER